MIGRIEGTGPIRTPSPVKRTGKTSASGTSFAKELDDASEANATNASSATSATSFVSGVFGLQEVDDATARASRGKQRANDILDELEELRLSLLAGTLSQDQLVRLVRLVNSRRLEVLDPRLSEILDEIDLRAHVELAKYTYAKTQE